MPRRAQPVPRRVVALATAAALAATLAACTIGTRVGDPAPAASSTASAPADAGPASAAPPAAVVRAPSAAATVLPAATPERAAVEASRALFVRAPVVVLAAASDGPGQLTAASAAVAVGAPELLTSAAASADVTRELARLDPVAVLVVGAASTAGVPAKAVVARLPAGADARSLAAVTGAGIARTTVVPAGGGPAAVRALNPVAPVALVPAGWKPPAAKPVPSTTETPTPTPPTSPSPAPASPAPTPSPTPDAPALPATTPPAPGADAAAVVGVGVAPVAALATFRAAGLPVLDAPGGDPRSTTASVRAFAAARPAHVIAFGAAFGDPARLASRVRAASTGVLAPGGGQLVFPALPGAPGKRYVALYGTPGTSALGVLGEQGVPQTVARAARTADRYRRYTHDTVVPAVEIIATIASAGKGEDGDYSRERSVAALRPLVEAAGAQGQAVVLDLQPGRADFLSQAKRYQSLLELPYVGLALDPEWRLTPKQKPLRQIGSVDVAEINRVVDWLADLTASHALPQKLFVVHEFSLRMVRDRDDLDTSRDELAMVIHVDGQGSQPAKAGTWRTIRAGAPHVHWGWKNFVDEDHPMLSPRQTYRVSPRPDLVTYQ
ncbi:hypothetical protein [Cellulomonas alba]|uniref:Lipoprotein n=1 Tax=Cellulomonas alba TaxID=3053467 RepID=A0ABT7SCM0_9CELL|nr:hypothetical protein [Cellulomonas alba]MDM7853804.1 hypothetical protein [Cellulomonas alba]